MTMDLGGNGSGEIRFLGRVGLTQKFSNAECPCTVSVDNQDNVWAITEHYQGSQHTTKFSKYNSNGQLLN